LDILPGFFFVQGLYPVPVNNETSAQGPALRSLIPLADFKAVSGFDDREDALCRYCLVTATCAIEQYCKRRLLCRKRSEFFPFQGDYIFPLREYPVREVLALYAFCFAAGPELAEPECYTLFPEIAERLDIPHALRLSPALGRLPGLTAFRAVYRAGYSAGKVPADLASACLELAAWNMSRYRGRRVGMTGNVRGKGQDGEHLEASMPENVRLLLEPYRRRTL
jgi:hypothetical protein